MRTQARGEGAWPQFRALTRVVQEVGPLEETGVAWDSRMAARKGRGLGGLAMSCLTE